MGPSVMDAYLRADLAEETAHLVYLTKHKVS
jgi:hypothetical protein